MPIVTIDTAIASMDNPTTTTIVSVPILNDGDVLDTCSDIATSQGLEFTIRPDGGETAFLEPSQSDQSTVNFVPTENANSGESGKEPASSNSGGKGPSGLQIIVRRSVQKEILKGHCVSGLCSKISKWNKLQRHLRSHVHDKSHSCDTCRTAFYLENDLELQSAIKKEKSERRLACKLCRKTFNQKAAFQIHMKRHINERRYRCAFCGMVSSQQYDLRWRKEHDKKPYYCEECEARLKYLRHLNVCRNRRHAEDGVALESEGDHSNETKVDDKAAKDVIKQIPDLTGDASTVNDGNKEPLDMVRASHLKDGELKKAGKQVRRPARNTSSLPELIMDKGPVQSVPLVNQAPSESAGPHSPYKFGSCPRSLNKPCHLKERCLVSGGGLKSGRLQHTLDISGLGESFTQGSAVVESTRISNILKKLDAASQTLPGDMKLDSASSSDDISHDSCDKGSWCNCSSLVRDLPPPLRVFRCKRCKLIFQTIALYESHVCSPVETVSPTTGTEQDPMAEDPRKKHTTFVRMSEEQLCFKRVKLNDKNLELQWPSDLGQHNRSQTVDSHMKTHTGEKHFTCYVCDFLFPTKESLEVHMQLHTGAKPFKCPHCEQRFDTSSHHKSHIMTHFKSMPQQQKRQRPPNVCGSQMLRQSADTVIVDRGVDVATEEPMAEREAAASGLFGCSSYAVGPDVLRAVGLVPDQSSVSRQASADGLQIPDVEPGDLIIQTVQTTIAALLQQQRGNMNITPTNMVSPSSDRATHCCRI